MRTTTGTAGKYPEISKRVLRSAAVPWPFFRWSGWIHTLTFTSPAGEFTEDDSDLLGGGDGDKPDYVFGIDA